MKLGVLGCHAGIGGARRTTSLLLDDDVLIDAGTGAGELSLAQMAKVDHIFLTHAHLDHCCFVPLLADAAAFLRDSPLLVHALPQTIAALKTHMLNGELWPDYSVLPTIDHPYIRFVPVAPLEPTQLGGRRITPLAGPPCGACRGLPHR